MSFWLNRICGLDFASSLSGIPVQKSSSILILHRYLKIAGKKSPHPIYIYISKSEEDYLCEPKFWLNTHTYIYIVQYRFSDSVFPNGRKETITKSWLVVRDSDFFGLFCFGQREKIDEKHVYYFPYFLRSWRHWERDYINYYRDRSQVQAFNAKEKYIYTS